MSLLPQNYRYTILRHLFLHFRLSFHSSAYLFFVAIKWYRSNNESCEGNDIEDPDVDFEQLINQAKEREDEDRGLPL